MKTLCLNKTITFSSGTMSYTVLKMSIYDIFITKVNWFNTVSHMSNRNGIGIKIVQWTEPATRETV